MWSFLEVTAQALLSMEPFADLSTDFRIDFEPIMNQMSPDGIAWQSFEFPHHLIIEEFFVSNYSI